MLLHKKAKLTSLPTLKDGGKWLTDPKEKANAFARVFASKSKLPEELVDTPFFGESENEELDWITFRTRTCRQLFKKLDKSKATGNDMISAEILKRLENVLAAPFTRVVRRLYHEGCWPEIWKKHVIVPIFKKGAAFDPEKYRGVHLTTILSKTAERMIAKQLVPHLRKYAFGTNQWAFSTGLSARDLVTMLVLSWI